MQKPCGLASKHPPYHLHHILLVQQVTIPSAGRGTWLHIWCSLGRWRINDSHLWRLSVSYHETVGSGVVDTTTSKQVTIQYFLICLSEPQGDDASLPPESVRRIQCDSGPKLGMGETFKYQVCVSHSVVSDSLWSHGLQPVRLLCLWNSPGKNIGVVTIPFSRGSYSKGLSPLATHWRWV